MENANASMGLPPHKTRLALIGEFSAGKSTLSKLLLGDAPVPVKVTATRLPPVWITHGKSAAFAVGHDGTETPIDIEDIDQVRIEDTRMIKLYNPSETLEICDLIDMPGISDPNMSSDVWMSVMDEVDSVVWCTQATQAWRQSEAATWEDISARTNGDNILVVTQVDKLRSERDLERVLMRVRKETEGQFRHVFPLSITDAIAAGEDEVKWTASGAADFIDILVEYLVNPNPKPRSAEPMEIQPAPVEEPSETADHTKAEQQPETPAQAPADYGATSVVPKRVRVLTEMRGRTTRPAPGDLVNLT
ncbi:dynamin family protein [Roseovarius faecimaris]|uniref:dynamin family protein n=1 Tax=Roseovarius faecimaris TaxID=2494550 RepID=UPI001FEB1786|nr:dynamin family protein [Roseovarius faecimaris]